jgi:hypothetical protein
MQAGFHHTAAAGIDLLNLWPAVASVNPLQFRLAADQARDVIAASQALAEQFAVKKMRQVSSGSLQVAPHTGVGVSNLSSTSAATGGTISTTAATERLPGDHATSLLAGMGSGSSGSSTAAEVLHYSHAALVTAGLHNSYSHHHVQQALQEDGSAVGSWVHNSTGRDVVMSWEEDWTVEDTAMFMGVTERGMDDSDDDRIVQCYEGRQQQVDKDGAAQLSETSGSHLATAAITTAATAAAAAAAAVTAATAAGVGMGNSTNSSSKGRGSHMLGQSLQDKWLGRLAVERLLRAAGVNIKPAAPQAKEITAAALSQQQSPLEDAVTSSDDGGEVGMSSAGAFVPGESAISEKEWQLIREVLQQQEVLLQQQEAAAAAARQQQDVVQGATSCEQHSHAASAHRSDGCGLGDSASGCGGGVELFVRQSGGISQLCLVSTASMMSMDESNSSDITALSQVEGGPGRAATGDGGEGVAGDMLHVMPGAGAGYNNSAPPLHHHQQQQQQPPAEDVGGRDYLQFHALSTYDEMLLHG